MEVYITWGAVGIMVLFLLIGFLAGFIRGLKRASLHVLFWLVSIVVAFFITKPIAEQLLKINVPSDGGTVALSVFIANMVAKMANIDLSTYPTAKEFIQKLPVALVSPILFIILALVVYFLFDIVYLIVARCCFGKKNVEFKTKKPRRWLGSLIGTIEAFLFMIILSAPITSLTKMYQSIATSEVSTATEEEQTDSGLKTTGEMISQFIPKEVNSAIISYNNSVIGVLAGAGNLDQALFDGLANFKFKGENIKTRKEILNLVDIYNDAVVVVNAAQSQDFSNVQLSGLKETVTNFVNNGLFKGVVTNVLEEVINNFDVENSKLDGTIKSIISDIKTAKDNGEIESFYTFLKDDITNVFDAVDNLLKSNLIQTVTSLPEDAGLKDILEIFTDEETVENTKKVIEDVLKLHTVNYAFKTVVDLASEQVESMFTDVEIKLNSTVSDKQTALNDLVDSITSLLSLKIDFAAVFENGDIMAALDNISDEDFADTIDTLGETFDKINNLEILVVDDSHTFTNILKSLDIDLLVDECIDANKDEEKTYTEFFAYIKTPVVEAKSLGLLSLLGQDEFNIDPILDKLLDKISEAQDNSYIASLVMPFKDLTAMNLNELVFGNIKNALGSLGGETAFIDLSGVGDDAWQATFEDLEGLLKTLNDKDHLIEGQTYIKYLLTEKEDPDEEASKIETLVSDMDKTVRESLVTQVFESDIFQPLVKQVFSTMDTMIGGMTGVTPTTDIESTDRKEVYEAQKAQLATQINQILEIALTEGDLSLEKIGSLLDILKENANNGGKKDGVFNEIFANIIWYLTGENLTENESYNATPNNEFYDKANAYISGKAGFTSYYEVSSYADLMKEIENALALAQEMSDKLGAIEHPGDISPDNAGEYAGAIKDAVDSFIQDKTVEEVTETVKELQEMVGDSDIVDTSKLSPEQKDEVANAIEDAFKENGAVPEDKQDLVDAIKDLLGLKTQAEEREDGV